MSDSQAMDEDEHYASSEDSDFAPDAAPAAASDASDSEDEGAAPEAKKQPAKSKAANTDGDAGYDNSGDEAIIERGRKRRRRAQDKGVDEDDEGGEGGLVKTRRQRAAECVAFVHPSQDSLFNVFRRKEERKHAAVTGPVTIDVDAVWAEMLAGSAKSPTQPDERSNKDTTEGTNEVREPGDGDVQMNGEELVTKDQEPSGLVRIRHTYNFAGRVHTEEKLVARNSAEAKLYFASNGQEVPESDEVLPAKRMARKAFRSAFEPITDQNLQRTDLNLGITARMQAGKEAQAKKLNTVEKSRMDWAGFVDKEGIQDELELAGKSKDSYAARQDFLARSEFKRDDEARKARLSVR